MEKEMEKKFANLFGTDKLDNVYIGLAPDYRTKILELYEREGNSATLQIWLKIAEFLGGTVPFKEHLK